MVKIRFSVGKYHTDMASYQYDTAVTGFMQNIILEDLHCKFCNVKVIYGIKPFTAVHTGERP